MTATRQWPTTTLLLAGYAVLLCARMPEIVIKGRFWAEEANIFFKNAWTLPPLQALLMSFGGYLNLAANASTLAARWIMPLELAPYLTITIALCIHLLAPMLLLTARDVWLQPAWVRLTSVLVLLLAPQVGEGVLQTLHCQFQLTLCCGLILVMEEATNRAAYARLVILLFAPLCGLVPIILLPLFCVRALTEQSRGRLSQAAVLAAGSAVQLVFFHQSVSSRGGALQPLTLLCAITLRYLDAPFLGLRSAGALVKVLRLRLPRGDVPPSVLIAPFLTFGPLAVLTVWRKAARPAFWLLAAGALIAGATYIGEIGGPPTSIADARAGERYVFVPQTLFGLSLLALAATSAGRVRIGSVIVIIWILAVGGYEYVRPWALLADGPAWRDEVALWRADPSHTIQIWPTGWSMTLKPSH